MDVASSQRKVMICSDKADEIAKSFIKIVKDDLIYPLNAILLVNEDCLKEILDEMRMNSLTSLELPALI